jgi:hypothetical protein
MRRPIAFGDGGAGRKFEGEHFVLARGDLAFERQIAPLSVAVAPCRQYRTGRSLFPGGTANRPDNEAPIDRRA